MDYEKIKEFVDKENKPLSLYEFVKKYDNCKQIIEIIEKLIKKDFAYLFQ